MMRTSDFDYSLPEELIAQKPPQKRGDSRMLVLDPATGACNIVPFSDFPGFMRSGDTVVINNTKVIRARLYAQKATGAKIEILLLSPVAENISSASGKWSPRWNCLLKPAKRVEPGTVLSLLAADGQPSGKNIRLVSKDISGDCVVEFVEADVENTLKICGHIPLPPYIKRHDEAPDSERYQTLYASAPGAVAAPTAGLHFNTEVFAELERKGVTKTKLTLHVGQGTFKPVTADIVAEHKMHGERYTLSPETADMLNRTRTSGGRILAVGTTSLRTLESCVGNDGFFKASSGETSIFIHPPYKVRSADMLLTNFHLPKSTLLMLVCAFAGYEATMKAYELAVKEKMRFFSYGDCMLITNRI